MKNLALLLFFFSFQNLLGQQLYLKIKSNTATENKTIDSIGYQKKHTSTQLILTEIETIKQKLFRTGYLTIEANEIQKINDSIFECGFQLGKQTKFIHINKGEDYTLLNTKTNIEKIALSEVEDFMNTCLLTLEKKGHSLAKIQLTNFRTLKNELHADLKTDIELKRVLNDIVINGYEKFPESHKKNIKRTYQNKVFNQLVLKNISNDFDKFRFVKQLKYPEILFTKDSTKVYVYLEKTKPNTFDGYIGFSNDKKKLIFNGYLDLKLQNLLNSGEKLNLYWKSDGKNQKTFDVSTEIPYILKSRLGIKAQLNIFKQDSVFQNSKTAIDLGYYFSYNSKIYLGYQSTESSDIQNTNNTTLSDYKNSFYTSHFDYTFFDISHFLFPEKTIVLFKVGLGNRHSNYSTDSQFFCHFNLSHNFYLNKKNSINLKSQNFYLKSNNYIINELFRFGGINSIRGFNENSLQGSVVTSLLSEYRYSFNDGIYIHSIIDYGYYKDKTNNLSNSLMGLGFGFGLNTKTGLFNLVYANGSTKEQAIKLSNSIVHISLKARF